MSSEIGFEHPLALWLLAALPLVVWWRLRFTRRASVPYPPLQYRAKRASRGPRGLARHLLVPVEGLLLSLLVLGLAGPFERQEVELFEEEGVDVVLALDISLSMLAADFPPNRLEVLRQIAGDFISRSGGNRVGVLVFAKDTFVHSPLTTDHGTLRSLLDGVRVEAIDQQKSGGTAVGDALLAAAEHLRREKIDGRDQVIVLITDGESNMGMEPVLAARYVHHHGIRLHAIGIGGDEPVEVIVDGRRLGGDDPYLAVLDETELRAVSEASQGRFYRATEVGVLERVFSEISRLERAPLEVRRLEVRAPLARLAALWAWFALLSHLVLAGLIVRRPIR